MVSVSLKGGSQNVDMLRLSDEQWERIRRHFPEENAPESRPGRKPAPTRRVLEGVLWILNTGAQWHMLPQSYPNYKTVHRRFQQWCEQQVLREVLKDLANTLREQGDIDEREGRSLTRRLPLPRAAAMRLAQPSAVRV